MSRKSHRLHTAVSQLASGCGDARLFHSIAQGLHACRLTMARDASNVADEAVPVLGVLWRGLSLHVGLRDGAEWRWGGELRDKVELLDAHVSTLKSPVPATEARARKDVRLLLAAGQLVASLVQTRATLSRDTRVELAAQMNDFTSALLLGVACMCEEVRVAREGGARELPPEVRERLDVALACLASLAHAHCSRSGPLDLQLLRRIVVEQREGVGQLQVEAHAWAQSVCEGVVLGALRSAEEDDDDDDDDDGDGSDEDDEQEGEGVSAAAGERRRAPIVDECSLLRAPGDVSIKYALSWASALRFILQEVRATLGVFGSKIISSSDALEPAHKDGVPLRVLVALLRAIPILAKLLAALALHRMRSGEASEAALDDVAGACDSICAVMTACTVYLRHLPWILPAAQDTMEACVDCIIACTGVTRDLQRAAVGYPTVAPTVSAFVMQMRTRAEQTAAVIPITIGITRAWQTSVTASIKAKKRRADPRYNDGRANMRDASPAAAEDAATEDAAPAGASAAVESTDRFVIRGMTLPSCKSIALGVCDACVDALAHMQHVLACSDAGLSGACTLLQALDGTVGAETTAAAPTGAEPGSTLALKDIKIASLRDTCSQSPLVLSHTLAAVALNRGLYTTDTTGAIIARVCMPIQHGVLQVGKYSAQMQCVLLMALHRTCASLLALDKAHKTTDDGASAATCMMPNWPVPAMVDACTSTIAECGTGDAFAPLLAAHSEARSEAFTEETFVRALESAISIANLVTVKRFNGDAAARVPQLAIVALVHLTLLQHTRTADAAATTLVVVRALLRAVVYTWLSSRWPHAPAAVTSKAADRVHAKDDEDSDDEDAVDGSLRVGVLAACALVKLSPLLSAAELAASDVRACVHVLTASLRMPRVFEDDAVLDDAAFTLLTVLDAARVGEASTR